MRRNIIIPIVFVIYLATVAYFAYPHFAENGLWLQYAGTIIASLIVFFLLHLLLKRRDKQRAENRRKKQASAHRGLRNDQIH